MVKDFSPIRLAVDRTMAMVRAFSRLAVAVLLGGAARLGYGEAQWSLLWRQERASFLAFAFLLGLIVLIALYFAAVGLRWLTLALWPGRTEVVVTSDAVELRLGPFGSSTHDWKRMRIEFDPALDPELIAQLPDDALSLRLRHPDSPHDLAEIVQRFCRLESEKLTGVFRPFVLGSRLSHPEREEGFEGLRV